MALARIISRSQRAAQSLAMDLLARGYAVEIISPDASPATRADLVVRVVADGADQVNGALPAQDHWIDFDAEQAPADVAGPAAEYWWPSEAIAPTQQSAAELNDSARLIAPQVTEELLERDITMRNAAILSEDRSGTWLLRASIGFAAIAVLVMFGLALVGDRAASNHRTSSAGPVAANMNAKEQAGVRTQTSQLSGAETATDVTANPVVVKTSVDHQKTLNAATPRRQTRARDEEGIIAPDTVTRFDRRQETKAASPTTSPAIKYYSDLN